MTHFYLGLQSWREESFDGGHEWPGGSKQIKWEHVDGDLEWRHLIDFSVQQETVSRGTVPGNTKASLKADSNFFWLKQKTEEWKKVIDEPGKETRNTHEWGLYFHHRRWETTDFNKKK